jgi:hypothetical protein
MFGRGWLRTSEGLRTSSGLGDMLKKDEEDETQRGLALIT